jgi:tRNA-dihydrouridine synthase B
MAADPKHFISPPEPVDVAWHAFILHTRDYESYCRERYGRVILTSRPARRTPRPTGARTSGARRTAASTTRSGWCRRRSATEEAEGTTAAAPRAAGTAATTAMAARRAAAAPRAAAARAAAAAGAAEAAVASPPSLTDPWALGGRTFENRVVLAPLAGIGNWFVRLQARRFGAGLVVSEMVSSFGIAYGNERTISEFLRIHPEEHPVSVQLFGHDPEVMRRAAAATAEAGADLIDLNMGCPVRKVCKTGAGAALLRDHAKAVAIARAASEGSGLPVTVKLRPGLEPGERDGVQLARRLVDEAGVAGIAFHPRYASDHHAGRPDYAQVRELVERLPVPVILSGGLSDEDRTLGAFAESGAAAVMLARGSLGNPWRFARLLGRYQGRPSPGEVVDELEWVIARAEEHLGTERAGRYLRKFYPWYADTMGLTRRAREPLVGAPTTAHARAALASLTGAKTAVAA